MAKVGPNESIKRGQIKLTNALERVCYGMELDPKYVDVVVKRWQGLTGGKATLEGDGRTFDDIADERREAA